MRLVKAMMGGRALRAAAPVSVRLVREPRPASGRAASAVLDKSSAVTRESASANGPSATSGLSPSSLNLRNTQAASPDSPETGVAQAVDGVASEGAVVDAAEGVEAEVEEAEVEAEEAAPGDDADAVVAQVPVTGALRFASKWTQGRSEIQIVAIYLSWLSNPNYLTSMIV